MPAPAQQLDFVRDFRADGGGFAAGDQYGAWQRLLAAFTGGTTGTKVFVPPGVYRFDQALPVTYPIHLEGAGSNSTFFLFWKSGGISIEHGGSKAKLSGIRSTFCGSHEDALALAQVIGGPRVDASAGLISAAHPQWRPSLDIACGVFMAPSTIQGWAARAAADGVPNYGWAYQAIAANGYVKRAVTCDPATDTFTCTAHGYANDIRVNLNALGSLPGNAGVNYNIFYVVNQTANTFQLSLTLGGASRDFTSAGSEVYASPIGVCGATEPTTYKIQNPRAGGGLPGGAGASYKTFTADTGTDFITTPSPHGLNNGDCVRVTTDGTLPAPLLAFFDLFVVNKTATTLQLSLTSGGAAINLTTAGSGTHTVYLYTYIDRTPITDGEITWNPVYMNGLIVKGSECILEDAVCTKWPSNAIDVNTSTLYAQDPSWFDGLPDYGNASRYTLHRCAGLDGGGSALYIDGYDASVGLNLGFDAHFVHGYGIFDHASFTNTHIGAHFDLCDAGTAWAYGAEFINCYTEGSRSQPVIRNNARWRGGINYDFSGCRGITTAFVKRGPWAAATDYVVGDMIEPTVDMGWWWYCLASGTSGGAEPPWKACMDHGLMDYRNAVGPVYTDTFKTVADGAGTLRWRAFISSEASTGMIDLSGTNTALNRTFMNRHSGDVFTAGGFLTRAGAFGVKAPTSTSEGAATDIEFGWSETMKEYRWRRANTDNQSGFGIAGDSHAQAAVGEPVAHLGMWVGSVAGATPGQLIFVDAVPANGSFNTNTVAIHRDASTGQPFIWHRESGGTWTVILNKP